jgi:hypothetical protein
MENTILNIIKWIIIMPTLIVEMIIKAIYNVIYFIIVLFICTIYPIIKKILTFRYNSTNKTIQIFYI